MMKILPLLATLAAGILAAIEPGTPAYRFDEVKSKVLRAPGGDEQNEVRVAAGDAASAGDLVRTGFWGKAVLSVSERKARFEIGSSTRARLATGTPGVLLTLERGRIKALFDALTDGSAEARTVAAPGALLAVRGTRYGLEVANDGSSLLAVFEGTVEVRSTRAGSPALLVRADEACTFGPTAEPRSMPMRSMGMNEHSWGMHGGMGMSSGSEHGMPGAAPDGRTPRSHGGGSHGGSPMGQKGH